VAFLSNLGKALGESVRNFREELEAGAEDGKQAAPPAAKPRESVPGQVGTALRKGRDALAIDRVQSDVRSVRSELGDLRRSVDRERDGLRSSLKGEPSAGKLPVAAEETPPDRPASAGDPQQLEAPPRPPE
jgi:Sec-independent protein translocase protein TatA